MGFDEEAYWGAEGVEIVMRSKRTALHSRSWKRRRRVMTLSTCSFAHRN
jgi:hypothetical protein